MRVVPAVNASRMDASAVLAISATKPATVLLRARVPWSVWSEVRSGFQSDGKVRLLIMGYKRVLFVIIGLVQEWHTPGTSNTFCVKSVCVATEG